MKRLLFAILSFSIFSCSDLVNMDNDDQFGLVIDDNELMVQSDVGFEDLQEYKPDIKITDFRCSATNDSGITTLFEGESYGLAVDLEFDRGLDWHATTAFYLAKDTLVHFNRSPGHLYTDWITPIDQWSWCGAPYKCFVVESPTSLGSNQLYINPMFWTEDPDGFGKLFGDWYLIAVADQKSEVNERDESNNIAWMKIRVSPKQSS